MNTVIKVENLSKQYRLGEVGTGAIKDDFKRWRYRMMGKEDPFLMVGAENDRTVTGRDNYVWALRDINFEVKQGEVLGIIGRNGAGKSTLLKILSRTTTPTIGSIKIKGRIASLLEVGTGFHGELSGRDNIFLNGAIMGMSKQEIKSKFDEIVDFAGVEKYIDTPVKRYSSGMYVRLAFGVAAHLEPEILIVDEVLAVGDAEFQKKALGKMKDVSMNGGRTVLFVSHNMASIQSLCNKCIFLKDGLLRDGPEDTELIISRYLKNLETGLKNIPIVERTDREGEQKIIVQDIRILNAQHEEVNNLISGQRIILSVDYLGKSKGFDNEQIEIALAISRRGEHLITVLSNKYIGYEILNDRAAGSANFILEALPFMTGTYTINVMIRKSGVIQDWIQEAKEFDVENGDFYKTGLNIPESHKGIYINYSLGI